MTDQRRPNPREAELEKQAEALYEQLVAELGGDEDKALRLLDVLAGDAPPSDETEAARAEHLAVQNRLGELALRYERLADALEKMVGLMDLEMDLSPDVEELLSRDKCRFQSEVSRSRGAAEHLREAGYHQPTLGLILAAQEDRRLYPSNSKKAVRGSTAAELKERTGWTWKQIALLVRWNAGQDLHNLEKPAGALRQAAFAASRLSE